MSEDELRDFLAEQVNAAGSQTEWARQHQVSYSSVSEFLRGGRGPGPLLLDAMGVERVITYFRISDAADD